MKQCCDDVEIYPVHKQLIFNSDDVVLYISPSKTTSRWKKEEYIVSAAHDDSSNMAYTIDRNPHITGMRVRLTFTFSGCELIAPLYVTVSGLSGKELSWEECPEGILKVPIEGFCIEKK